MDDSYCDGNALAGPLAEVFAVDMTAATGRCASCGQAGPVAALRVYDRAPGLVARCPSCLEVVLRVVRAPGGMWLDLTGAASLLIALPAG
ncbi:MAG TPA: DUF6510 family protein [Streptosporangiaceae bacterium]|jgi:hypothetical protein|nr:DUF6510 family protein [Streptosporangiaceae bacterium]